MTHAWFKQNYRATYIILILIILIGTYIRLPGLTSLSMSHIEMYVPGIELSPELSVPGPRFTIRQIFWSMMEELEPHPPGYYLFMYVWTKLLNTEIFTLRFPSLLFGVGSVLLLFVLGYLERSHLAGLVAAGMLALNGYHVIWSQLAKMYMMGCFLGLLSTITLLLLVRGHPGKRVWFLGLLYLGASLSGLATTIWFWPIIIAQIVWVFILNYKNNPISGLLRLQILILILGTPLITLAIFQSQRHSYVSEEGSLLQGLGQFLQFGFLFTKEYLDGSARWYHILATIILVPMSVLLIVFGLKYDARLDPIGDLKSNLKGPSILVLFLATIFVIPVILVFAKAISVYNDSITRYVIESIALPFLIFILFFLTEKRWPLLQSKISSWPIKKIIPIVSLSDFLALIPVGIILIITPLINLFASRGILLYIPFLILLMSKGLVKLASRTKYWIFIAGFLVVIHPLSVYYIQYSYHSSETDFKSLSEEWIPKIEDSDLIFIRKHPMATPILYYLKPHEYNFVANNYAEEVSRHSPLRIWVLSHKVFFIHGWVDQSLIGYKQIEVVRARGVDAELYVRQ
jgi:uncharacterized membrane protein